MSGYLKRLVSSAMRPSAGVHPVVAPLYATPEFAISNQDQEPAVPGTPAQKITQAQAEFEPSGRQGNLEASLQNFVPVATTRMDRATEDSSQQHTTQRAAQAHEEYRRKHEITREAPAVESGEIASCQSGYRRLLPEVSSAVSLPQSDFRTELSPIAVPQSRRERADKSRSARREKREPDEIQITIGRIEVTAVPEPPSQALKSARKQLSLDDYLQRADARGR
jgi:hypothetical protein